MCSLSTLGEVLLVFLTLFDIHISSQLIINFESSRRVDEIQNV